MLEQYATLAKQAAQQHWDHVAHLVRFAADEAALRRERSVQRRITQAGFPVIKTLEHFHWNWPTTINRLEVQHLFRPQLLADHANIIFLSPVGLGKTHLTTALGYAACLQGLSVRFTTAVEVINALAAAQRAKRLKQTLDSYRKPARLILDELGYLPIDKTRADLLFQIISQRYEQGSTVVTSTRAHKHWAEIFNNGATHLGTPRPPPAPRLDRAHRRAELPQDRIES